MAVFADLVDILLFSLIAIYLTLYAAGSRTGDNPARDLRLKLPIRIGMRVRRPRLLTPAAMRNLDSDYIAIWGCSCRPAASNPGLSGRALYWHSGLLCDAVEFGQSRSGAAFQAYGAALRFPWRLEIWPLLPTHIAQ